MVSNMFTRRQVLEAGIKAGVALSVVGQAENVLAASGYVNRVGPSQHRANSYKYNLKHLQLTHNRHRG